MEDVWRLHEGYPEDSRIGNGAQLMNIAAARGDSKTVKDVLKRGCCGILPYDYHAYPLQLAINYGHAHVASLLMKDVAERSGHRLIKAAKHGRFKEVQTLLAMGVKVSCKTKSDWTPLHFAAKFGHLSIVKYLIAKGADINCRGVGGQSPLFEAAFYGNLEIAEVLLDNGANVNVKGYEGMTPVRAASSNGHLVVAHYLETRGGHYWLN